MTKNVKNKTLVWNFFRDLAVTTPEAVEKAVEPYFAENFVLDCAHPINHVEGRAASVEALWKPLLASFTEFHVRPYIFFGGVSDGSEEDGRFLNTDWVATTGYCEGVFKKDLLDIPANDKPVFLRYAALFQVEEEKIVYGRIIFDFLDLMQQCGIRFIEAQGNDVYIPGPYSQDGLILGETDPEHARRTIKAVRNMGKALDNFAEDGFEGMTTGSYFADDFNWYGPCGIGACKGIPNYEERHQIPFLKAFPDRGQHGLQKLFHVAEENYSTVGGWCDTLDDHPTDKQWFTTHTGEYLGIPATNKKIGIRCYDFYRLDENGVILENWVVYDLIHFVLQMGVDIFAKLREMRKENQGNEG